MNDLRLRQPRHALTIVGVALLLVTPLAWWSTRDVPDVGDLPAVASTTPSPTVTPSITTTEQTTGLGIPRRSGLLSQQDDLQATPSPKRLSVSAISMDAEIVAVGIDPSGAMEIPTDVDQVGWYRFGPLPGEPGTAVLAGHVDSRTQGRGAFFDLQRLGVGDLVVVETDADTSTWEVVARRQYGKDVIPLEDVFSRDGPPRLALITCGGEFDDQTRRYLDNIVVYAVPLV